MNFKRKGFTIVELLIVIVVIGILAAITIVSYGAVQKRALNAARISEASQWLKTLQVYQATHGTYPSQLSAPLSNFCLGDRFPDVTGDGIGDCRDTGPGVRPGDPVHIQSVNAALMTELRTISSTLPNGPNVQVARAYIGPYIYRWSGGELWLYTFLDGDDVCPPGSVNGWESGPRGVSLCRWQVE